MTTAYNSSKLQAGVQPRVLPPGVDIVEIASFLNATAFVLNDTLNLVKLEANPSISANGPTISSLVVAMPPMDSSTGFSWIVGDSNTTNRYITTSTVGRSAAGGIVAMNNYLGLGYQPFVTDFGAFGTYPATSQQYYTIYATISAAATGTPTTGNTIIAKVAYTYDP